MSDGDTRDAFRPSSPWFGAMVSPVAEVRPPQSCQCGSWIIECVATGNTDDEPRCQFCGHKLAATTEN